MSKVLQRRDVGMDCEFVVRGETEQDVMAKAAEHAQKDHGMDEIPGDVLEKVKSAIHDE